MKNYIIAIMACASMAQAREIYQLRQWSNNEGKSAFARYLSFSKDIVSVKTPGNELKKIKYSALSNEDKVYLWRITRNFDLTIDPPTVSDQKRLLIPSLNQVSFGTTHNNCGPNAVANFLLWWDQNCILRIPDEEKNLEKLADDIHRDLESAMGSKNGTDLEELNDGLKKFLIQKEIADYYSFEKEVHPAKVEQIEASATGNKLAVLSLRTMKKGREDEGHYVSVVSCKENMISFNTWGLKLHGRLVPGVINKKKVIFIEMVREPGSPLYEWLTEKGGGFFIAESDKIFSLAPTKLDKKRLVKRTSEIKKR